MRTLNSAILTHHCRVGKSEALPTRMPASHGGRAEIAEANRVGTLRFCPPYSLIEQARDFTMPRLCWRIGGWIGCWIGSVPTIGDRVGTLRFCPPYSLGAAIACKGLGIGVAVEGGLKFRRSSTGAGLQPFLLRKAHQMAIYVLCFGTLFGISGTSKFVIPAEAGIQPFVWSKPTMDWVPACAGTTGVFEIAG